MTHETPLQSIDQSHGILPPGNQDTSVLVSLKNSVATQMLTRVFSIYLLMAIAVTLIPMIMDRAFYKTNLFFVSFCGFRGNKKVLAQVERLW